MVSRDFACQLEGYGLTTASILYRMPDHRSILQEFIWQEYDLAPRFPELNKFLAFWSANLEGPLYCVRVGPQGPARTRRPARRQRRIQAQLKLQASRCYWSRTGPGCSAHHLSVSA